MENSKVIKLPVTPTPSLDEISDWRFEISQHYDTERVVYSETQKIVFVFIKSLDRIPFMVETAKKVVLEYLAEEIREG